MAERDHRTGLLRPDTGTVPVTAVELFFDLVYVLAVTQLTGMLDEQLGLGGSLRALILLLALWWAWMDTAWLTNWLDPDRLAVRLALVGVMLLSLLMSAILPEAFGDRG